ncbi:metalloprotease [Coprinopsis sp. MPI-PUGE-AT-0042]|nr:metalloprotease [Coprinopsis sp. MPI-PUGE-AT-0042]
MMKSLSLILLAINLAPYANATSLSARALERRSTSAIHRVGQRGLEIESYHPPPSFEPLGHGIELPESLSPPSLEDEALDLRFSSGFASADGVRHAYLQQAHDSIPFANAVANIAFKDNRAVSYGSSFVKPGQIAASTPTVTLESALPAIEEMLDGKYNGHPTRLEYLVRPDNTALLVYAAQIQGDEAWYDAFIDAHTGELVSVADFKAHATYRVVPITSQSLAEGRELIVDPEDPLASPSGWHNTTILATSGNNAGAFIKTFTNTTSQSASGTFDYLYDLSLAPNVTTNIEAARTNAFYVFNMFHDFTYRYGFTETAWNFQIDNLGKGGAGNDSVMVKVQDGGINNAYFYTPPDGQSGVAYLYLYTAANPWRDTALSNDILIHEATHGLQRRLVGGGGFISCWGTFEGQGLGEGWSDALADWVHLQNGPEVTDFVLGAWLKNNTIGARNYPFSTSRTTNPDTYGTARSRILHGEGEIFANMLHNVYAALVEQYGWTPDAMKNPESTGGNVIWLHHLIDSMALSTCPPTSEFPSSRASFLAISSFLSGQNARDAWIQADFNRYGGVNKCLLWRVFAGRGLGVNAANERDNFELPGDCM